MPTSRTKPRRPARASAARPKPRAKVKAPPKKAVAPPPKAARPPAPKAARPPAPKPAAAPGPIVAKGVPPKGVPKTAAAGPATGPARSGAGAALPGKPARPAGKKSGRKSPLSQRRGPNGELFQPGDLLLPTGPQGPDEIQYLLRGSVAAEHAAPEAGVSEIVLKKGPEAEGDRGELSRFAEGLAERFESGTIEPLLPTRPVSRRNFSGVVERAKHRRREIGAFLRGLDLGRTESSHMDSHGEASLQSLMEWAARLENLAEADEPDNADYAQFHRGMDQLENTTEALIVDVELTLRRLRDRVKA
jgi:hypothetical protein